MDFSLTLNHEDIENLTFVLAWINIELAMVNAVLKASCPFQSVNRDRIFTENLTISWNRKIRSIMRTGTLPSGPGIDGLVMNLKGNTMYPVRPSFQAVIQVLGPTHAPLITMPILGLLTWNVNNFFRLS